MDIASFNSGNRKTVLLEVNATETALLVEALSLLRKDRRSSKQAQRAANLQRDMESAHNRLLLTL